MTLLCPGDAQRNKVLPDQGRREGCLHVDEEHLQGRQFGKDPVLEQVPSQPCGKLIQDILSSGQRKIQRQDLHQRILECLLQRVLQRFSSGQRQVLSLDFGLPFPVGRDSLAITLTGGMGQRQRYGCKQEKDNDQTDSASLFHDNLL